MRNLLWLPVPRWDARDKAIQRSRNKVIAGRHCKKLWGNYGVLLPRLVNNLNTRPAYGNLLCCAGSLKLGGVPCRFFEHKPKMRF